MGLFFVYIVKSSVCLAGFYLFYRLLLSKETFHRFNRIALLTLLLLSLLLPLVQLTTIEQTEVHQTMLTIEQLLMMADMPVSEVTPAEAVTLSGIQILLMVYLSGVLFFACRHIYSLGRLLMLLRSGEKEKMENGMTLVIHQQKISPFSWMKYIVISKVDLEEDGREILIHEAAHVRNRHSVDLLIADICIFFQWFNPASWLLKQELQNIHEYEADESVIREGVNARQYQLLLIKKAVGTRLYSMANSFNHSKLKKRITMMLKEKSNPWARLKYLYVLPLAAIAVTAFARPEISGKMDEISAVKVNDFVQIVGTKVPEKKVEVLKDTVKKDAPKEEALKMPFSIRNAGSQPQPLILVDGKEITGEQMQRDINPDMIESISVLKDEASTAIYGDKAKHGVILITLKGKDVQNVLSLSASDPEDGVKVVGVVKDHLDKPLAGASVFISGTVSGTMSDAYGRFVLLAPKNAMLRISYTGMTTVEKAVAPEVNVTLNPAG
ncbi:TonB-dependent receptor plug domain-containing protein [Bacteroides fragilis]|uniref:M56 family peptidase n=3 Tax=Bacteroides fragilis TaxID=817 RepID=A0A5C6L4T4_BACFG|nr:tonB-dependent Receptor Plug domain protein [Bacteroides fragilis str. 3996 N(B) 6]EXY92137.1 tonB-dependent Receptor Plug domain protein [Bacteroides fragilis str. 3998T(B)3]EXY96891.1 tonB-dependent Receptor Plug domain protein [Bacteroides fragilis str. 3998 T(B) 4]KAA4786481.1 TonB-dependent receptor plug domain-containing protein [Bacteroides fragilis]KAA4800895.1 TonB-dependent receptor plug domain-containing protein [Bacteroides fragilis]